MNFHNLDVYKCALEFLRTVQPLLQAMGRGEGDLKDQFRRASISIPLNIAEASGKVSPSDRGRFFAIARGSAMECAAILDCVQIPFPNLQEKADLARPLIGTTTAFIDNSIVFINSILVSLVYKPMGIATYP